MAMEVIFGGAGLPGTQAYWEGEELAKSSIVTSVDGLLVIPFGAAPCA